MSGTAQAIFLASLSTNVAAHTALTKHAARQLVKQRYEALPESVAASKRAQTPVKTSCTAGHVFNLQIKAHHGAYSLVHNAYSTLQHGAHDMAANGSSGNSVYSKSTMQAFDRKKGREPSWV